MSLPSDMHKKIAIDKQTSLALDELSKLDREYTEEVFEIWPEKLQTWARQNRMDYKKPPQYLKTENRLVNLYNNRPRIISPSHGCEYFKIGERMQQEQLALMADAGFDSGDLFWFVDDTFYQKSSAGQKVFWSMRDGDHKISVVDANGRSSFVQIVVR